MLQFKNTSDNAPQGHVTGTKCRPGITAAFEGHWEGNTTLWPLIRLVGENALEGKSKELQQRQAISYLHFLLLARPDRQVCQGILIISDGIWFLFGIGGVGIRALFVRWTDKDLDKLMHAFIYRVYDPEHFADAAYTDSVPDLSDNTVKFTVRMTLPRTTADAEENPIDCPGFSPVFASNPFGTRTHVLSNPFSQVQINGQTFTVIKDQLCRRDDRFEEQTILSHIHEPMRVPGVVEVLHSETIETPLSVEKQKQRLVLRQSGTRFLNIQTLRKMLEVLFDVLEGMLIHIGSPSVLTFISVLRYLRLERRVLHRDISKGNILYVEQPSNSAASLYPGIKGESICFIRHLLGERYIQLSRGRMRS